MAELQNKFSISTYNCFSIRKKIDIVRNILSRTDILVCQETLLLEEDSHILHMIDPDFTVYYVPSKCSNSDFHGGRPIGGFAIFVKNYLNFQVSLECENDNFCLAKMQNDAYIFYLINVYMPCDTRSNQSVVLYENTLGAIQSLLNELDSINLVLVGDFNADWNRGGMWNYLSTFIEENSLVVNDLSLPSNSFTYLSPAHNTTSWIDHVISSRSMDIHNISIMYDTSLYDHFPLRFEINISEICKSPVRNSRSELFE